MTSLVSSAHVDLVASIAKGTLLGPGWSVPTGGTWSFKERLVAHVTGRRPSAACTQKRCRCNPEKGDEASGCWWMRLWSDMGRLGVPDAFRLDTAPDGMLRVWIAEVNVTHHADDSKWFDLWDLLDCEDIWCRVIVVDRNGTVSEPWYDGALARERDSDHCREVYGGAELEVCSHLPSGWFSHAEPRESKSSLRDRARVNMNRILDARPKAPAPRAGRLLDNLLDTGRGR
jgi:hypothetical protein